MNQSLDVQYEHMQRQVELDLVLFAQNLSLKRLRTRDFATIRSYNLPQDWGSFTVQKDDLCISQKNMGLQMYIGNPHCLLGTDHFLRYHE